jgi:hypothetical protein
MAVASAPKPRLARLVGTFLRPGISRQGREYTRENIASAVETLNQRIAAGDTLPPEQRALVWGTHRAAEHIALDPNAADSSMLVARITRAWQEESTGNGRFEADVPDTAVARDYASLAAHGYAPSLSVRFDWDGPVSRRFVDGRQVESAPRIITKGIDMTPKPGIIGAQVDEVHWEAAPRDVAGSIVETFDTEVEAPPAKPAEASPSYAVLSLRFEAVDDDNEMSPAPTGTATVVDPDGDGDVDGLRCPQCGAVTPITNPRLNPDAGEDGSIESAPADALQETSVSTTPAPGAAEAAPPTVVQMTADQFKELMTEAFKAGAAAVRENTEAAPAAPAGNPEGGTHTEAATDVKGLVLDAIRELAREGAIEVPRKGLVNTESATGETEPAAPKTRREAIAAVAERRTKQIEARRELGLPV